MPLFCFDHNNILRQINCNTMLSEKSDELQKMGGFQRVEASSNVGTLNLFGAGVSCELMQVISSQNALIMRLLEQQDALCRELRRQRCSSDSGSGTNDKKDPQTKALGDRESTNPEKISSASNRSGDKNGQYQTVKIIQKPNNIVESSWSFKKVDFINKGSINNSPQQALQNSDQKQKCTEKRKQTQTKNMIKNLAKSIFSYIRKNKVQRQKVLKALGIDEANFGKVFEKYHGHIYSITQLRSLWSGDGNPFHKAFRVLSFQYLRRHCLGRTFNSRVENYSIHLKYRKRLLEVLQNPTEFNALKTN